MKGGRGVETPGGLLVPLHVQGDPLGEVGLGSHPVDRLLHLAMTTVASFHRVGGRGQQRIIEKGQGLLEVGREQVPERLAQGAKAPYVPTQFGQFLQGRFRPTAAVEEPIDLLDDRAQSA